jgi:L-rhamnose mutarotase
VTRRYALALDLADDPGLVAEYERHHASVWPDIEASLRASGIDIWRSIARAIASS